MSYGFRLLPVWRPYLPVSSDDQPLTVAISDFLPINFPYDRLVTDTNSWLAFLMDPRGMAVMIIAYILSEPLLSYIVAKLNFFGNKSAVFKYTVAAHNAALAIFSLVVAYNSWLITLSNISEHGFDSVYCDHDGQFWTQSGYGAWITIFYVSKYYEFLDTWILILKRKKPSFLQLYHHVGVVVCMWGGVACHAAWLLIVMLLNSIIHTLMYTYFFIKTLYPTKEIKAAKYLTLAQIFQFISGLSWTFGVLIRGNECDTSASRLACLIMDLYAVGLIVLFNRFAAKKYKKK